MLSCKWPITIIKTRPNVFTHQKLIEPHRKKKQDFFKKHLAYISNVIQWKPFRSTGNNCSFKGHYKCLEVIVHLKHI